MSLRNLKRDRNSNLDNVVFWIPQYTKRSRKSKHKLIYQLFNNILIDTKCQEYLLIYINLIAHKTDEVNKFIWYDKDTGYFIYSPFCPTYRFIPEFLKTKKKCPQLNFKSLYTHMSFVSQKFLCLKKIL